MGPLVVSALKSGAIFPSLRAGMLRDVVVNVRADDRNARAGDVNLTGIGLGHLL